MAEKDNASGRDPYWDIVKGLLIFLVILGHAIQFLHCSGNHYSHPGFKAIYMFHMPLFALVSGYFAWGSITRRGMGQVARSAVHLLTPGLFFLVVVNLGRMLVHVVRSGEAPEMIFSPFFFFWFLVCMFECIFFMCLLQRSESWYWRLFWCIFPIALAIFTPLLVPLDDYFVFLYPFFLLGSYLKAGKFDFGNVWLFLVSALVFACTFCVFAPDFYVYCSPLSYEHHDLNALWIAGVRWLGGLSGCFCFIILVRWARFLGRIPIILGIGKNTLAIYVLQAIFYGCVLPHVLHGLQLGFLQSFAFAVVLSLLLHVCALAICKIRVLGLLFFGKVK